MHAGRYKLVRPMRRPFCPGFLLQYSFTLISGFVIGMTERNVVYWAHSRRPPEGRRGGRSRGLEFCGGSVGTCGVAAGTAGSFS